MSTTVHSFNDPSLSGQELGRLRGLQCKNYHVVLDNLSVTKKKKKKRK
jgi:hypothetical protein